MAAKFITRAYIVSTFAEYDRNHKWDDIYRNLFIESTKQEIEGKLRYEDALSEENFGKNRYQNVLPYDQHRVRLQRKKNGQTDFINASPLKLPFANRDYILSQGPLETTTGDFWQMVWEQNTRIIVMLNNIHEKGSMKCFPYYVSEKQKEKKFGDFKVELEVEIKESFFITRMLKLTALDKNYLEEGESDSRTIHHFQFTHWPDFGVPSDTGAFLDFCQHVSDAEEKLRKEETTSPVVVHCSAGIGRSGAFVVVDSLLNYFRKGEPEENAEDYEIPETMNDFVLMIRKYRMGLIQTPEQLRFCWQALNDWIKAQPEEPTPDPPAEVPPRKRPSTSESNFELRKQKIQEMREKLRRVEEYKNKWWRRWLDDDQTRFWIGSSAIAVGAIMATYVYTYYFSK